MPAAADLPDLIKQSVGAVALGGIRPKPESPPPAACGHWRRVAHIPGAVPFAVPVRARVAVFVVGLRVTAPALADGLGQRHRRLPGASRGPVGDICAGRRAATAYLMRFGYAHPGFKSPSLRHPDQGLCVYGAEPLIHVQESSPPDGCAMAHSWPLRADWRRARLHRRRQSCPVTLDPAPGDPAHSDGFGAPVSREGRDDQQASAMLGARFRVS